MKSWHNDKNEIFCENVTLKVKMKIKVKIKSDIECRM